MTVDLLVVLLLILLNGFFAMSELAIVSARRARLQQLSQDSTGARLAIELAENPNRFLSTVQIGITLTGILAGAFSGATVADALAAWLVATYPTLQPYAHALAITLVVSAITYLSLIFGELVPKRLALANAESIASRVARPIQLLARFAAPVAWLLAKSSDLVLRALGLHRDRSSAVTEEEIRHMVEEGAETGAIESLERDMVHRVFRLGDRTVKDIMTPRTQLVWVDADASVQENLDRLRGAPHSRFPVMRGATGEILGLVQVKDLVGQLGTDAPVRLFDSLRQPVYVPETTRALRLPEMFRTAELQVALVVDEYGDVQGLVTLSDILEAIVGEIPIPGDEDGPSIVRREDGSFLLDGMLPVDTLRELFSIDKLPGEDEHDFSTLAGLVVTSLQRIPEAGDLFDWNGYRFEVMDMDGPRVDKVLIVPPAKDEPPAA